MKRLVLIGVALVCLGCNMGCTHVPRNAVMGHPETGHEVILSKKVNAGTIIPFVSLYGATAQRANQRAEIELYKGKGYEIKWESKERS
jgi:hypothetical protein